MQHTASGVSYWTYGTSDTAQPPLLFIHGFTGSHKGFSYIVEALGDDFSMIVPDLPGFGKSTLFQPPWTIDQLAYTINQWVSAMDFGDKKPIVIGHSMGGLVAASMLYQHPNLYSDTFILISPVTHSISMLDKRKIGAELGRLQYGIGRAAGRPGKRIVTSKILSRIATRLIMTTKDQTLKKAIYQHHFDNLDHISSIDFYYQLHRDINRRGAVDYAAGLSVGTSLIITGDRDNVTPLAGEKDLARKLQSKLVVVPGVGHLLHYEQPTKVAAEIRTFLNR